MRDGGPTAVLQEPITTAEAQICLRLACSDDPLVGPGTVDSELCFKIRSLWFQPS